MDTIEERVLQEQGAIDRRFGDFERRKHNSYSGFQHSLHKHPEGRRKSPHGRRWNDETYYTDLPGAP